jgi:hypothetical protein
MGQVLTLQAIDKVVTLHLELLQLTAEAAQGLTITKLLLLEDLEAVALVLKMVIKLVEQQHNLQQLLVMVLVSQVATVLGLVLVDNITIAVTQEAVGLAVLAVLVFVLPVTTFTHLHIWSAV